MRTKCDRCDAVEKRQQELEEKLKERDSAIKMCEEMTGALEWIKNPEYFNQSCIPKCEETLDNYRKWKEGMK